MKLLLLLTLFISSPAFARKVLVQNAEGRQVLLTNLEEHAQLADNVTKLLDTADGDEVNEAEIVPDATVVTTQIVNGKPVKKVSIDAVKKAALDAVKAAAAQDEIDLVALKAKLASDAASLADMRKLLKILLKKQVL